MTDADRLARALAALDEMSAQTADPDYKEEEGVYTCSISSGVMIHARPLLDLAREQIAIAVEYAVADADAGLPDWKGYDAACDRRDAAVEALIDALAGDGDTAP